MASKNSVKIYSENAFYHVYNRGVEKRDIFLDEQDYSVFLSYLQTYTTPKDEVKFKKIISSNDSSPKEKDKAIKQLRLKNYSGNIELVCYALLPNHFHLLIHQHENVLNRFMNSLGTRYGMYFNRKYKRTGILFQDVYKAVVVYTDEQLLHLSRYIHLNT
ncbi:transposase, partial [Candidatus Gottesmanbacteria bacterium]|nr:transposase [Candidatus Gottesmanbacteria bacterium]